MYALKKLFIIIYISNLSERFNKIIFSVFKIHIKKLRNNWNVSHKYELVIMRNENASKF